MRQRYRDWTREPERTTGASAASATSACRSRSGTRSTPSGEPDYDAADRRRARARCRSIRPPTCRRATPRRSATSPAASPAEADVFDTWFTSSLTPQIGSRWRARPRAPRARSSRPTCARRATRSSAPGRSTRSRRRCCTRARCRGTTSRSRAGSSTPTARRCRRATGNVVTPMPLLDAVRRGRVRYWAASARLGADTAFDEKVLQGRQAPRHEALQRRQVRARRRRPTSAPIAAELDRAFAAELRALVDARDARTSTRFELRARARRRPRASSGRASPTPTSSW